jgi:hypothetical protein
VRDRPLAVLSPTVVRMGVGGAGAAERSDRRTMTNPMPVSRRERLTPRAASVGVILASCPPERVCAISRLNGTYSPRLPGFCPGMGVGIPHAVRGVLVDLQAETKFAPVAQLDRASVYGTEGRGFESLRARFVNCLLISRFVAKRRDADPAVFTRGYHSWVPLSPCNYGFRGARRSRPARRGARLRSSSGCTGAAARPSGTGRCCAWPSPPRSTWARAAEPRPRRRSAHRRRSAGARQLSAKRPEVAHGAEQASLAG